MNQLQCFLFVCSTAALAKVSLRTEVMLLRRTAPLATIGQFFKMNTRGCAIICGYEVTMLFVLLYGARVTCLGGFQEWSSHEELLDQPPLGPISCAEAHWKAGAACYPPRLRLHLRNRLNASFVVWSCFPSFSHASILWVLFFFFGLNLLKEIPNGPYIS